MSYALNWILVVVIAGVLTAGYGYEIVVGQLPCPLCMLQRLGMMGVATGALLNLRMGARPMHYGLSLISAVFGGAVALRQISLHVCPGWPIFGEEVMGLALYSWSFVVFVCSVLLIAILLFLCEGADEGKRMGVLGHLAFAYLGLVTLANVITTLWQCGLGACNG